MKVRVSRADAQAALDEINAKSGYPRKLEEHEIVRVGDGIHVEDVWTTSAGALAGDGDEVVLTVSAADEKHIEPARRARLRAAVEAIDIQRDPEERPEKGR